MQHAGLLRRFKWDGMVVVGSVVWKLLFSDMVTTEFNEVASVCRVSEGSPA